jgi:hypothetical protein
VTRLHSSDKRQDREKATGTWGLKYTKIEIKLKHNFMNIIVNRARQKVSRTWYYIGENRHTQEDNNTLQMTREAGPARV